MPFIKELRQTANVKRRRGIILAAVLAVVLGGLLWLLFFRGEPEPVYQGKRLTKWLEVYTGPITTDHEKQLKEADDAVRHIGTNAIPTLLRMLRARDSALTLKLVALAQKQHLVKIHYVQRLLSNVQAQMAFLALGAEAKDAVPALVTIYEDNISPDSRICTIVALRNIGPDAKAAVPLLLRVATDTNTPDQNARTVRRSAIYALGHIHSEPQSVLPALIKALNDPDTRIRGQAAGSFAEFGPDAKATVPILFKLLEDQDLIVRINAAEAIKNIDPEAAAQRKAEIDAAIARPKPQ